MVTIKNGFNFKDSCENDVTYRVWTKKPENLEGKCFATDVTRVRSIGLSYLADRKEGITPSYHLKKGLEEKGLVGEYTKLIREMVGITLTERWNVKKKPLGCDLNPETYAIAKALYDLTSGLTMIMTGPENPVTDIVIRGVIFSADHFSEEELEVLKKAGHIPSEHVALQLTTDLYKK